MVGYAPDHAHEIVQVHAMASYRGARVRPARGQWAMGLLFVCVARPGDGHVCWARMGGVRVHLPRSISLRDSGELFFGNVMAMPHKLRRGAKPSVADIADSEGLAMGGRTIRNVITRLRPHSTVRDNT